MVSPVSKLQEGRCIPGAHRQTNNGTNVTTSSNVQVSWKQSCHIRTSRDRVGGNIGAKLGEGESERNKKDTKSSCSSRSFTSVGVDEEIAQQV